MRPTYDRAAAPGAGDFHDLAYRLYNGEKTSYRYEVADDMASVRITTDPCAANGIWILAEVMASGAGRRAVGNLARRMELLARRRSAEEVAK